MKWLLSGIVALLIFAQPALAQRAKYQNWCEQGGYQVTTQGQNSTTRVQRSFPACTVAVFIHGSNPPAIAPLYSDDANTRMDNPFDNQNRNTGQYFFYADNGRYDIQISATGLTTYTLFDVTLTNVAGGGPGPPTPGGMNCGLVQLPANQIATCAQMTGNVGYPQWFGAKADGVVLGGQEGGTGCFTVAVGSGQIMCPTANFTAAEVGKRADLAHAGTPNCGPSTYGRGDLLMNCNLVTTIASVQGPMSVTLSNPVLSAVNGNTQFAYASSDDAAVQAALDSGIPTIAFAGVYGITGALGSNILGNGMVGGVFQNRAVVAPGPGVGRLLRIGPVAFDNIADVVFVVENGSKYFTMSGLSIWGTNSFGELTSFGPTHDGLLICSGTPNAQLCSGLPGNVNGSINDTRYLNLDISFNWGIGWHLPGTGPAGGPGVYDTLIAHGTYTFNSYDGINPNATDGFIVDSVNASYNGTGGLELTGYGSITVSNSIFNHNKSAGMSFGGMTDTWSLNKTCSITGNDFSENGNGYFYDVNNPTGGNTVGGGLLIGIGVRSCTFTGNTMRHNHLVGLELTMVPKDGNVVIDNNVISTNGLVGVSQLSLGAYGNFYGVTMSNNRVVNEAYGDIMSIGRTNGVVTVETAAAVNYYVGYSVYLYGTPGGAFDSPQTNPGQYPPVYTPFTVTSFIDGRTFTIDQPGPDLPVQHYQPGLTPLGQVYSPTGGFNQNQGIAVQDCRDSDIRNNTVRLNDWANVSFTQFLPGSTYFHCNFTSDTNTMGFPPVISATGNRDLYLNTSSNNGTLPLIPKAGSFVATIPSVQNNATACTTPAAPGATCPVTINHGFGGDLGYIDEPGTMAAIRTTCTLDGPQTGIPIVLKVTQTTYYQAVATIGTYDGQAAGGGTLTCFTNFRY